jgi:hypothetical protein
MTATHRWGRRLLAGLIVATALGCGEEPVARPIIGPIVGPREERPARARVTEVDPDRPALQRFGSNEGRVNLGSAEIAAPPPEREPTRDLPMELRELAGDPTRCLPEDRASLPASLTISITATATATGVVTRAEVTAQGLAEAGIACVRRAVEGGRFRAPVPDAPRTVQTTLVLNRAAPPAEGVGVTPTGGAP